MRTKNPKQKIAEKDIQKQIKDYLQLKKCLVVKFNSVGIYKKDTGKYIPMSQKGVSDLLFWCGNSYGAIECKVGSNRCTPDQAIFLEEMRKRGGIAIVARSLDDVSKII